MGAKVATVNEYFRPVVDGHERQLLGSSLPPLIGYSESFHPAGFPVLAVLNRKTDVYWGK